MIGQRHRGRIEVKEELAGFNRLDAKVSAHQAVAEQPRKERLDIILSIPENKERTRRRRNSKL